MDLEESLTNHLQDESETFRIDGASKADWALRKIKASENEIEKIKTLARLEIEKIKEWEKEQLEKQNNRIDYFNGLLFEYITEQRQHDPNFKSIALPNGRVGFRKQQPKWEFDDSVLEAFEQKGLTDLIRVKKDIDKTAVKKQFDYLNGVAVDKDTGEVVEGIKVIERPEALSVSIKKE